jgi:hypothetical protein
LAENVRLRVYRYVDCYMFYLACVTMMILGMGIVVPPARMLSLITQAHPTAQRRP